MTSMEDNLNLQGGVGKEIRAGGDTQAGPELGMAYPQPKCRLLSHKYRLT